MLKPCGIFFISYLIQSFNHFLFAWCQLNVNCIRLLFAPPYRVAHSGGDSIGDGIVDKKATAVYALADIAKVAELLEADTFVVVDDYVSTSCVSHTEVAHTHDVGHPVLGRLCCFYGGGEG